MIVRDGEYPHLDTHTHTHTHIEKEDDDSQLETQAGEMNKRTMTDSGRSALIYYIIESALRTTSPYVYKPL